MAQLGFCLRPIAEAWIRTHFRELHLFRGPLKGCSTDWATASAAAPTNVETPKELLISYRGSGFHRRRTIKTCSTATTPPSPVFFWANFLFKDKFCRIFFDNGLIITWKVIKGLRVWTLGHRIIFCSNSLPLASTRWVQLTLSSLCPLF